MKLRLGGVPEHFNYLWQMSSTRESFRKAGFYCEWTDFPGGTGAMARALDDGEIDLAIMLTEGAIASIAEGKDFRIEFPFVVSPLFWGVFSSANRDTPLPKNYEGKFAISRLNSGSHLMAMFLAQREGISLTEKSFLITRDLEGAKAALAAGQADYFLWEQYMTRPLVRQGLFVQNDKVSAPWPAFVFVRKTAFPLDRDAFLPALQSSIVNFLLKPEMEIINSIQQHYHISAEDAREWLKAVRYYDGNNWWPDRMTAAAMIMHSKGMIQRIPAAGEMLAEAP